MVRRSTGMFPASRRIVRAKPGLKRVDCVRYGESEGEGSRRGKGLGQEAVSVVARGGRKDAPWPNNAASGCEGRSTRAWRAVCANVSAVSRKGSWRREARARVCGGAGTLEAPAGRYQLCRNAGTSTRLQPHPTLPRRLPRTNAFSARALLLRDRKSVV